MHSWLVKGDLPAKEKEQAATELFELDVNKSATKKAKTGRRDRRARAARPQPFFWYI
jgi:hypothetical protein